MKILSVIPKVSYVSLVIVSLQRSYFFFVSEIILGNTILSLYYIVHM